jgi:hypothetical protein|tara:strand:- start:281 stop:403 length:123 start_codon:yes stop_codon:yes gene_type:complete
MRLLISIPAKQGWKKPSGIKHISDLKITELFFQKLRAIKN